MQESSKAEHYFLSANTPIGFISRFEQLYNAKDGSRAYILKGGPGTGKSHFISKIAQAMQAMGMNFELFHCTSDSNCLDGISIPALKVCVIDGTPPHSIEPKYPGVVETIINLGDCWDENKLYEEHDKIILFASRINAFYDRAYRFLAAASSLLNDTFRLTLECVETIKIERYAQRLAKREITPRRKQGHETVRFLTGITPEGVVCYKNNLVNYNKVFVIEDDYGLSRLLLSKLKNYAITAGYDVVACYCPISPNEKLEHLLIPSLSIAFVTSNHFHTFNSKGYRHIHFRRFIDNEMLKLRRARVVFNRRAARELVGESIKLLSEAKANYDILKIIYSSVMDFNAVEKKAQELIEKITKNQIS
jgi:hypothetical protein